MPSRKGDSADASGSGSEVAPGSGEAPDGKTVEASEVEADEADTEAKSEAEDDSDAAATKKTDAAATKKTDAAATKKTDAAATKKTDAAATKKFALRRRSLPPLPKVRISATALVAAVLVILVGVGTWLFSTRPVAQSPIELSAFDEILSATRSGIVDVTSFDYLTLDQDIAEIDRVTADDLHDETIAALEDRREQLVTDQQVSATEVIAASVTEATETQATAIVVLRARIKNVLTPQETVTRYRIQVNLRLVDGRWLLTGLTGA